MTSTIPVVVVAFRHFGFEGICISKNRNGTNFAVSLHVVAVIILLSFSLIIMLLNRNIKQVAGKRGTVIL